MIARSGSSVELKDVDRVAAGTARRIVLLPPIHDAAEAETDADAAGGDAAVGGGGDAGVATGEGGGSGSALRDATGLALALQRSVQPAQPSKRASVIVHAPPEYHLEAADDEDGFGSHAEACACPRPLHLARFLP